MTYSKPTIHKRGFIATVAVVLLALGSLAFMYVIAQSVFEYSESVYKREMRLQKELNVRACAETKPILLAKDYFLNTNVFLSDLGCTVKL